MHLSPLGVSAGEERIYRYLLRNPGRRPEDVAAEYGLDRDTLEETIDRLRLHELVVVADDRKLTPVDPSIAVERLIERRLEAANAEMQRISTARAAIHSLRQEQQHAGQGGGYVDTEQVEEIDGIRARLNDLAFFTHREILALQPGDRFHPEAISVARPLDLCCLRRGVSLRTVVSATALQDADTSAYLAEISALGAAVRSTATPFERMVIYDREVAVVAMEPGDSARGALIVRQPGLVAGMISLFETLWGGATPVPTDDTVPSEMPTDTERRILAALTRADKDETAARELGMSVRTLRRHIADLMFRVGATNRFQVALHAKSHGWI